MRFLGGTGVVEKVSGLYDFRNRWYWSGFGSFVSLDPIAVPVFGNLYVGFLSQPLRMRDQSGLSPEHAFQDPDCKCPCTQADYDRARARAVEMCDNFANSPDHQSEFNKEAVEDILAGCKYIKETMKYGGCVRCPKGVCAQTNTTRLAGELGVVKFCCLDEHNRDKDDPNKYAKGCGSCDDIMKHEIGNHVMCLGVTLNKRQGDPTSCAPEPGGIEPVSGHTCWDALLNIDPKVKGQEFIDAARAWPEFGKCMYYWRP